MIAEPLENFEEHPKFEEKVMMIERNESSIDDEEKLHLFTWSPNPADLPDADFRYQHLYNVNILSTFLSKCETGCCCVESTQLGNPHYHGWYQVSERYELARIATVKTLQRFGNLKTTDARKWNKFCFYKKQNALYYYKEDFTSFLDIPHSVIDATSRDDTDWNYKAFFTKELISKSVIDRLSDKKFYEDFYKNSDL